MGVAAIKAIKHPAACACPDSCRPSSVKLGMATRQRSMRSATGSGLLRGGELTMAADTPSLHGAANPVMNETYQQELARLELANQILEARRHARLSQKDLAERIGTKQTGVARMERAGYTTLNLRTLAKIAVATGSRLDVRLVPPRRATVGVR